ncbi:MAG: leucyl aminopeptidase [Desulfuromonadaceae bacterium]|nr:leucyl aminopeptidase [Desulfuromonadaceae bacterium]
MLPEISFIYPAHKETDCDARVMVLEQKGWERGESFPPDTSSQLGLVRSSRAFSAKADAVLFLPPQVVGEAALILVGLGDAPDATQWRQAGAHIGTQVKQKKIKKIEIDTALMPESATATEVEWLLEGCGLELYTFDKYKSDPDPGCARIEIVIHAATEAQRVKLKQVLQMRMTILQGTALARDLVNEPSNVKNPEFLACTAWEQSQKVGIKTTILGQNALEQAGLHALLAVAQGSSAEPRLIVMEYRGGAAGEAPVALVGKAVTFDSGGISLKPGEGMEQMKMDMAGGAAVMATLISAARLQLPLNVVGVIAAVENMPSGSAQRPGDIVRSAAGKSIEVINTDAEGRLILADALHWVGSKNPRAVIDIATLTGACIIALGHHTAAVLGSDAELVRDLIHAGEKSGEHLWELPLRKEYAKQLESSVADLKNTGGRPAGTITAAAFLQHFAPKCPWAHVDIAGTAWSEKGCPGQPAGGTGFGVRLLLEYLQRHA